MPLSADLRPVRDDLGPVMTGFWPMRVDLGPVRARYKLILV